MDETRKLGTVTICLQIVRKVPTTDPKAEYDFDVYATCFTYSKSGEVWVVTNRYWEEDDGTPQAEEIVSSREFRGNGRTRYMIRDRSTTSPYDPDYDSAVWTGYDGDLPTGDFTIDVVDEATQYTYVTGYQLGTAEADLQPDPFEPTYYHGDQIGSTRAMTDDVPDVDEVVYTAFGEIVYQDLSVGTRYRYASKHGYECFDDMNWGEWLGVDFEFPYLHLGHRWYDPTTGRFLQRDPIGLRGGANVYDYVDGVPLFLTDAQGLAWYHDAFLWVTGGRRSWLDDRKKVKKAQKLALDVSITCASSAVGLGAASRLSGLRHFRFMNNNRFFRIGPGKWPGTQGRLPRIRIGTKDSWFRYWRL